MSAFVFRVVRLFVAGLLVAAIAGAFGSGMVDYVTVGSKHSKPVATAQCTLTGSTVGGALVLSGSGYAPNTAYAAEIEWPSGGAGTLPANSDNTGAISASTFAWWSGAYHASIYTTGNHTQLMASCSTTIP